ncbi:hypothetical protein B0H13DRAFT_1850951 [Mycena leptocephala]|nr:hypothetical protein B0H13DRAFT_1850951 [Mycena leptocephala]
MVDPDHCWSARTGLKRVPRKGTFTAGQSVPNSDGSTMLRPSTPDYQPYRRLGANENLSFQMHPQSVIVQILPKYPPLRIYLHAPCRNSCLAPTTSPRSFVMGRHSRPFAFNYCGWDYHHYKPLYPLVFSLALLVWFIH